MIVPIMSVSLTACSSLGVSDSSLDYQKPNVLPPLKMGDEDSGLINPIFPLPKLNTETTDNTFKPSGNEFELPRPNSDN